MFYALKVMQLCIRYMLFHILSTHCLQHTKPADEMKTAYNGIAVDNENEMWLLRFRFDLGATEKQNNIWFTGQSISTQCKTLMSFGVCEQKELKY